MDLGSSYLRAQSAPATPSSIQDLNPSTCANLSAFKALLGQYRKLDDAVTLRMNRAHALAQRKPNQSYADLSETECSSFFQELLSVWRGREEALAFCSSVAEANLARKRKEVLGEQGNSEARLDLDRASREALYSEQTKVDQIRREQDVERIIRRRTLSVFLSKCRAHPGSFVLDPTIGSDVRQDLLR